jgi:hypothetical protein
MAKNLKKKRMSHKQVNRTLQRMQTYANTIVNMYNNASANEDEAMASTFAVAVRIAKKKGTRRMQFIDEATSAWDQLSKLPIDHDELVLVDAEIEPPWFKTWRGRAFAAAGVLWFAVGGAGLYVWLSA